LVLRESFNEEIAPRTQVSITTALKQIQALLHRLPLAKPCRGGSGGRPDGCGGGAAQAMALRAPFGGCPVQVGL